jgi:hypothetical protein
MADYAGNAAKCKEMAASSTNENSRAYWQRMEAFWLERERQAQKPPAPPPNASYADAQAIATRSPAQHQSTRQATKRDL